MQFPRLVYKSASEHLLVRDENEFAQALKIGWHKTVPEALDAVKIDTPDTEPQQAVKKPTVKQGASGKAASAWGKKPENTDETI